MDLQDLRNRYHVKCGRKDKLDANGDLVQMRISFEEWLTIWTDSGHLEDMGRNKGEYCMSRYNDIGHYEIGNVFIQLHSDNVSQAQTGKKNSMYGKIPSEETKRKISEANKNPSDKTRQKMSESANNVGKNNPMFGRHQTADAKRKQSEKAKNRVKTECPYCHRCFQPGTYVRWHGDKCKYKLR